MNYYEASAPALVGVRLRGSVVYRGLFCEADLVLEMVNTVEEDVVVVTGREVLCILVFDWLLSGSWSRDDQAYSWNVRAIYIKLARKWSSTIIVFACVPKARVSGDCP